MWCLFMILGNVTDYKWPRTEQKASFCLAGGTSVEIQLYSDIHSQTLSSSESRLTWKESHEADPQDEL